jgi:hypothetical protein
MKMLIGTFAKKCFILFISPVWIVKAVSSIKVLLAGDINGFFTIVHPSKNRVANIRILIGFSLLRANNVRIAIFERIS